jgi:hypothetical protein
VRLAGGGWATATATRDIATTVNICVWVRVKAQRGVSGVLDGAGESKVVQTPPDLAV